MSSTIIRMSIRRAFLAGVLLVGAATSPLAAQSDFLRSDANADGLSDIADAITSLSYLFGGAPVVCLDALDANDDGLTDIADPITILGWVFLAAADLAPPFLVDAMPGTGCGQDPTEDDLTCEEAVCIPADGGI